MALFSMKPLYKDWLSSISKLDISTKIDNLMYSIQDVNNKILEDKVSNNILDKEIKVVTRKLLYLNLVYNNEKLKYPKKDFSKEDTKMDTINDNIKSIQTYEKNIILKTQKKNIDILSIVNLIFLPLSFIVGYYGMNFVSMGTTCKNIGGPYNFKYGQVFVWLLVLIVIGFIFIFKKVYFK
jgi:Mg2+ and Co2+ transporter CorA